MFEKTKSFFRGLGRLIAEPEIIDNLENEGAYYQARSDHEWERAEELESNLNQYKSIVKLSSNISKVFFDREIGKPQVFQEIQVGKDGKPIIQMDHRNLTSVSFHHMLEKGVLEPLTPEQAANQEQWPASMAELNSRAEKAIGLDIEALPIDMGAWRNWSEIEAFVQQAEDPSNCGIVFYDQYDWSVYSDAEKYIKAYEEGLDCRGPWRVKALTITNDPAVRKAIEDLYCGVFGEVNPLGLEDYAKIAEAPASDRNSLRMAALDKLNREQNAKNEFTHIGEEELAAAMQGSGEMESECEEMEL